MSKWWRIYLPGHLACLPITIGYAIFCFVWYRARSWGFRNGVVIAIGGTRRDGTTRIIGQPGAQTIGAMTVFADSTEINRDDLHVHENVHIVEAFVASAIGLVLATGVLLLAWPSRWWLGLAFGGTAGAALYSLAYVVVFLRWYLTDQGKDERPGWHDDYLRNVFERWAYAAQARYKFMPPSKQLEVWS